jgi:hypothetical protein
VRYKVNMAPKNPKLRFLAARVIRTVYHLNKRVVIWHGQFRRESGFVIVSVGKRLHVRLTDPSEGIRRYTTDGIVVIYKTSCCLIA